MLPDWIEICLSLHQSSFQVLGQFGIVLVSERASMQASGYLAV